MPSGTAGTRGGPLTERRPPGTPELSGGSAAPLAAGGAARLVRVRGLPRLLRVRGPPRLLGVLGSLPRLLGVLGGAVRRLGVVGGGDLLRRVPLPVRGDARGELLGLQPQSLGLRLLLTGAGGPLTRLPLRNRLALLGLGALAAGPGGLLGRQCLVLVGTGGED